MEHGCNRKYKKGTKVNITLSSKNLKIRKTRLENNLHIMAVVISNGIRVTGSKIGSK